MTTALSFKRKYHYYSLRKKGKNLIVYDDKAYSLIPFVKWESTKPKVIKVSFLLSWGGSLMAGLILSISILSLISQDEDFGQQSEIIEPVIIDSSIVTSNEEPDEIILHDPWPESEYSEYESLGPSFDVEGALVENIGLNLESYIQNGNITVFSSEEDIN